MCVCSLFMLLHCFDTALCLIERTRGTSNREEIRGLGFGGFWEGLGGLGGLNGLSGLRV